MAGLADRARMRLTQAPPAVSTLPEGVQGEVSPAGQPGAPGGAMAQKPAIQADTMAQPAAPAQPQGAQQASPQPGGVQPANEQEMELASRFMANVAEWLYGDGYPLIVKELRKDQPIKAAGKVAAKTMLEQEHFAEIAGHPIPNNLKFGLGQQIVEELFTVMEKEGIFKAKDPKQETQAMTEALMFATEYWASNAIPAGKVTEQERQALGSSISSGAYDQLNMKEPW